MCRAGMPRRLRATSCACSPAALTTRRVRRLLTSPVLLLRTRSVLTPPGGRAGPATALQDSAASLHQLTWVPCAQGGRLLCNIFYPFCRLLKARSSAAETCCQDIMAMSGEGEPRKLHT